MAAVGLTENGDSDADVTHHQQEENISASAPVTSSTTGNIDNNLEHSENSQQEVDKPQMDDIDTTTSEVKSELTSSTDKVVGMATGKQAVIASSGAETVDGVDIENSGVQHQGAFEDLLTNITSSTVDESPTTIKIIGQCLTTFPRHLLDCELRQSSKYCYSRRLFSQKYSTKKRLLIMKRHITVDADFLSIV